LTLALTLTLTQERRETAGGSARRQPRSGRRPRANRNEDDTYSYDEQPVSREATRWEPRKEPGCGCTGHKNAHGFGGFCKAWEEALDPGQRPWCYVSDACAAPDARRGSFGAKHVECTPVYADAAQGPRAGEEGAPSGRGGSRAARRGRRRQRGPRGRRLLASRPPAAAAGPRLFSLYYLPYDDRPCVTGPASSCTSRYAPPAGAAVGFRQRARAVLQRAGWRERVRRAAVTRFEARTPRDSFAPMEVAATAAETAAVRAHCARRGRRLLVWAEPRTEPIRMPAALPLRWVGRGVAPPNATAHRGAMLASEFYTFQLGVWAPLAPLRVRPRWVAPLRGPHGAELAPWRLRCVNAPNGSEQASSGVAVRRGGVQALWFGLDLPSDAPAGTYRGTIVVEELEGGQAEEVQLELELAARRAEQRGDSEPWRHSRLRWLDSTAGEGAVLASADHGGAHRSRADVWQRVELEAERLRLSASGARKLTLSRRGLPASLAVGSVELLAEPMQAHPPPFPCPWPGLTHRPHSSCVGGSGWYLLATSLSVSSSSIEMMSSDLTSAPCRRSCLSIASE